MRQWGRPPPCTVCLHKPFSRRFYAGLYLLGDLCRFLGRRLQDALLGACYLLGRCRLGCRQRPFHKVARPPGHSLQDPFFCGFAALLQRRGDIAWVDPPQSGFDLCARQFEQVIEADQLGHIHHRLRQAPRRQRIGVIDQLALGIGAQIAAHVAQESLPHGAAGPA